MGSGKPLIITAISIFLLVLIVLAIILHYPMNLIVDTSLLAIVGICSLVYILIWSLQKDKLVMCDGHIDLISRSFPVMYQRKRRLYSSNMQYFYEHSTGVSIVLKNGEIIDIENPIGVDGRKIDHIEDALKDLGLKEMTLSQHLKRNRHPKRSYISKM